MYCWDNNLFNTKKELQETPATLMRPKAPKMGKRVLLEKKFHLFGKD